MTVCAVPDVEPPLSVYLLLSRFDSGPPELVTGWPELKFSVGMWCFIASTWAAWAAWDCFIFSNTDKVLRCDDDDELDDVGGTLVAGLLLGSRHRLLACFRIRSHSRTHVRFTFACSDVWPTASHRDAHLTFL